VILANPPFMSPKGGIKPHKRFSVQASRSEVLFVDYMAEHLTATGRAAIVVPEGIIFQSGTAYKALRKMLVDNSLVTVVSLPAGVFNPYSGVKTSILILDKRVHKQTDKVLFIKVQNDGFNLGAQRRAVVNSDLPEATRLLRSWMVSPAAFEGDGLMAQAVTRARIGAGGDFNLSGERYLASSQRQNASHPLVPFQEVCTLEYGISLPKQDRVDGPYPVLGSNGITGYHNTFHVLGPTIVVGRKGSAGEVTYVAENCTPIDTTYFVKLVNPEVCDIKYLYQVLCTLNLQSFKGGAGIPGLNRNDVYDACKIPLPPIEVQHQIVAEIEGYQKIIDGARQVLDNYKPHIPTDPAWPVVSLGDVCQAILTGPFGTALHESDYVSDGIPVINPKNIVDGVIQQADAKMVSEATRNRLQEFTVRENDMVIGRRGEMGRCAIVTSEMNGWLCGTGCFVIRLNEVCATRFAHLQISSPKVKAHLEAQAVGVTMLNLNQGILSSIQIPLPDLETQRTIVAEIEAEQALVAANRELIRRFEAKIKTTIDRVWSAA